MALEHQRRKQKSWVSGENHPVRSRIVNEGTVLEQVSEFKYLGCVISMGSETERDDVTIKLPIFKIVASYIIQMCIRDSFLSEKFLLCG